MPNNLCKIEDCGRPVRIVKRQLCRRHYERWRDHGDPSIANLPRYWTSDEDRRLLALLDHTEHGVGPARRGEVEALAFHLDRSRGAARGRLHVLRRERRANLKPSQRLTVTDARMR